jgi:hypothetical protein
MAFPAGWRAWAVETAPRFEPIVDHEFAKFVDHFRGNGKPMKDWPATWRNWWRRSVERAPRTYNLPVPTARDRKAAEWRRVIEESEREGVLL